MDWKTFWNESPQVREADACRQVGRTLRRLSYSDREIQMLVEGLERHLQASPDKTLLDLACGNGLITSRLAGHFKRVRAVDYSRPLIETARTRFARRNVEYVVGDASDLEDVDEDYDCVLLSGAFQFFDEPRARRLLQQIKAVLKDDGRLVLGDVADRDRIWNFYRGLTGRWRYGVDALRRRPIIGHWWRPSALTRIAREVGWDVSIHYQPADLPNSYFRYDAVLTAPDAGTTTR